MYYIRLQGTAYERGRKQGAKFKTQIHEAIISCRSYIAKYIHNNDFWRIWTSLVSFLNNKHPDIIEEIRGISEGSGLPFKEIIGLNLYWDLLCGNKFCTAIAFLDSENNVLIGKTTDAGDEARFFVLKKVVPVNGIPYIGISMVGAVWVELGINSKELIISQNTGPFSLRQKTGTGIPSTMLPGIMLGTLSETGEAIDFIKSQKCIGMGLNMIIGDKQKNIVVVEKSFDKTTVRDNKNSVVFCTNHFKGLNMKEFQLLPTKDLLPNSKERYALLDEYFSHSNVKDIDSLKRILKFHGDNISICQHADGNLDTKYAYIIKPNEKIFALTDGKPCLNDFNNTNIWFS